MDIFAEHERNEFVVSTDEGSFTLNNMGPAEIFLDLFGLCQARSTTRVTVRYDEDLVVPYDVDELTKLVRELLRRAEDMTRINMAPVVDISMLVGGDES